MRRKTIGVALAAVTIATTGILFGSAAFGHGSMQNPASRTYTCFLEGAESPDSAACRAAIEIGGTQPVYDWNEVNIANAAGRHRELIPDGKLCSANREKYRGFDLPRTDWPATKLASGATHRFTYKGTAPHPGSFDLYVTRPGYDPTQPLRWADLEHFHQVTNPPMSSGAYQFEARIPARSGRHLVYSIWQRSDSTEAFYTCSDVDFSGTTTPTPSPTPTTSPTPTPTPTPTSTPTQTPAPGNWTAWRAYAVGAVVNHEGVAYRCLQAHTSQPGWEPSAVPALWRAQ